MGKNAAFNHMIQTNCSSWEDVHRVEKKEIFTRLKLQKQTSLTKIKSQNTVITASQKYWKDISKLSVLHVSSSSPGLRTVTNRKLLYL